MKPVKLAPNLVDHFYAGDALTWQDIMDFGGDGGVADTVESSDSNDIWLNWP